MIIFMQLLVLFWAMMMLKVSIVLAQKPLKYAIIPVIVMLIFMFSPVPWMLVGGN